MWGNAQGWMIAVVLAGLIGLGGWQAHAFNTPTAATPAGRALSSGSALKLDVDPATIVPTPKSGDPAALYRKAIADVKNNGAAYDAFDRSTDPAVGKALPAVQALLAAAPLDGHDVLAANLGANIGYNTNATPAELELLRRALGALERTALLLNAAPYEKLDEAKTYFEAEFTTGARMFAERLRYMEAVDGVGRMTAATAMLKQIAQKQKDAARVQQLEDFETAAQTLLDQRMTPVWKTIYLTDDALVGAHVGDAYAFASPVAKERLWRIEAILQIGRLQHNAGGAGARPADQLAVKPTLAELEKTESDPAIKAAVSAAQNCTIQEFRTF